MREGARRADPQPWNWPAGEVKNRRDLAFDIPPDVAKMIIEYRQSLSHRKSLVIDPTGLRECHWDSAKGQQSSRLVDHDPSAQAGWASCLTCAPVFATSARSCCLMPTPGNFENHPGNCLGHANLNTTVGAYRRHRHQPAAQGATTNVLVEQALAAERPMHRRNEIGVRKGCSPLNRGSSHASCNELVISPYAGLARGRPNALGGGRSRRVSTGSTTADLQPILRRRRG